MGRDITKAYRKKPRKSLLELIDKSLLVKVILPRDENKYRKSNKNLKRLGFDYGIERVETLKILLCIVFFVIFFILNIYYVNDSITKKIKEYIDDDVEASIGNNLSYKADSKLSEEERIIIKEIYNDPVGLKLIKKREYQELAYMIKKIETDFDIPDDNNIIATSIIEKFISLSDYKLKPHIIVLYFLVSVLISSYSINFYFNIKNMIYQAKIDNEIRRLNLLTVVLAKNTNMPVKELLTRLSCHSKVLKPYFEDCLSIYQIDDIYAINTLMEEVDNPSFTKYMSLIQQNLISDRDTNIRLLESLRVLEQEISGEKDARKTDNKSLLYTVLSFPLIMTALFLIFIPIFSYVRRFI